MFRLKNKAVLLTGSTGGIGKEIAFQMSSLGAKLILTGTNEEKLKALSNTLPNDSDYIVSNLNETKNIENLSNELNERGYLIDILIKNGIVKKNKNPKDKRSFIVTVTEKGEFLQSKLELEIESFVTKIFQKTSSVDQEELKKNLSSFHWIVSKYNLNN